MKTRISRRRVEGKAEERHEEKSSYQSYKTNAFTAFAIGAASQGLLELAGKFAYGGDYLVEGEAAKEGAKTTIGDLINSDYIPGFVARQELVGNTITGNILGETMPSLIKIGLFSSFGKAKSLHPKLSQKVELNN